MRSGKDKNNDAPADHPQRAKKVHSKDGDMGAALRSVYQRTIDERVPDDLLDLLGKLD